MVAICMTSVSISPSTPSQRRNPLKQITHNQSYRYLRIDNMRKQKETDPGSICGDSKCPIKPCKIGVIIMEEGWYMHLEIWHPLIYEQIYCEEKLYKYPHLFKEPRGGSTEHSTSPIAPIYEIRSVLSSEHTKPV